jgi:histone chaperone ASF1
MAFMASIYISDLEWKVVYVGSAHDARQDQVLDEVLVGPVPIGVNKFVLQADPPVVSKLPPDEILGVTVVLVICSYKEREFVRVGYYVNNELLGHDPEQPIPTPLDMKQVQRQILADKPRVTKFTIPWDETDKAIVSEAGSEADTTLKVAATEGTLNGTPSTLGTAEVDD